MKELPVVLEVTKMLTGCLLLSSVPPPPQASSLGSGSAGAAKAISLDQCWLEASCTRAAPRTWLFLESYVANLAVAPLC